MEEGQWMRLSWRAGRQNKGKQNHVCPQRALEILDATPVIAVGQVPSSLGYLLRSVVRLRVNPLVLLSTYYVPDTVLDPGDTVMNKADQIHCPQGAYVAHWGWT